MFDTHALIKKMTKAGMPVEQAEAVIESVSEAVESDVATKLDVAELSAKIDKVEAKLEARIDRLDAKIDARFKDMELRFFTIGLGMMLAAVTILGFLIRFLR